MQPPPVWAFHDGAVALAHAHAEDEQGRFVPQVDRVIGHGLLLRSQHQTPASLGNLIPGAPGEDAAPIAVERPEIRSVHEFPLVDVEDGALELAGSQKLQDAQLTFTDRGAPARTE